MNLLLFPPALSEAKSIHESLASGSLSGVKAAPRPHSETAQLPLVTSLASERESFQEAQLPLQELTHFEINLYDCFLLDLGEVRKLSVSSTDVKKKIHIKKDEDWEAAEWVLDDRHLTALWAVEGQ